MSYDETPLHNGQKCDLRTTTTFLLLLLLYHVLVDGFMASWINVDDDDGGGNGWLY